MNVSKLTREHYSPFNQDIARNHFVATSADESQQKVKKPSIVIWPTWSGLSEFEKSFAQQLAEQGFNSLAIDLYGTQYNPESVEDKAAQMKRLTENHNQLIELQRAILNDAINLLKSESLIVIGFCLGGKLAIESGININNVTAAISFHGLLDFAKPKKSDLNMNCNFLLFNGYNDPMVSTTDIENAADYFTKEGLDWQMVNFGNTAHSFMLPEANNPEKGSVFQPKSAERAFQYLLSFLKLNG